MSVAYTRGRNEHGDGVLIITVTGWHDIYRLTFNHLNAQSEFFEGACKTFKWMRRAVGAPNFDALDKSLTGGRAKRYSTRRGGEL